MKITYAAKSNRKELVKALVTLTSQPPTYSGPPTYNYYVGDYTVDVNGDLVLPDHLDENVVDELTVSLENMGFTYIAIQKDEAVEPLARATEETVTKEGEATTESDDQDAAEKPVEESAPEKPAPIKPETPQEDELTHITLSFPVIMFTEQAIERMRAIVASKAILLKKALATDNLDIIIEEDRLCFPWFTDHGIDGEVDAYSKLAFAIAKMAITQTRVVAKEKQNPDEKLAMRLFLIRLGFIGDEYKSARSILMRNFDSAVSRKQVHAAVNLCMPEISISSGS